MITSNDHNRSTNDTDVSHGASHSRPTSTTAANPAAATTIRPNDPTTLNVPSLPPPAASENRG